MTLSIEIIRYSIDTLTAEVVERYAKNNDISLTDALKLFMKTKTFDLLRDSESFLYLESVEYVYDMLEAEFEEDIERWLEV
jgi:hypothetical protein